MDVEFHSKLLTIESLPSLKNIILSRQRVGGYPIDQDAALTTFQKLSGCIVEPDNYSYVWGGYYKDTLCSVLSQSFARPIHNPPVQNWLMSYLAVNPEWRSPWNYSKNGLDQCWKEAFQLAESRGIHSVRWSLPTAWAHTQERTKKTSAVWKDYTIKTYATVTAGEVPINALDRWVAGNVKTYDVSLKEAYRS